MASPKKNIKGEVSRRSTQTKKISAQNRIQLIKTKKTPHDRDFLLSHACFLSNQQENQRFTIAKTKKSTHKNKKSLNYPVFFLGSTLHKNASMITHVVPHGFGEGATRSSVLGRSICENIVEKGIRWCKQDPQPFDARRFKTVQIRRTLFPELAPVKNRRITGVQRRARQRHA